MQYIHYKNILYQSSLAFVWCEYIPESAVHQNFMILEHNPAFENLLGLQASKISHQKLEKLLPCVTEILSSQSKQPSSDYNQTFFSSSLQKWINIRAIPFDTHNIAILIEDHDEIIRTRIALENKTAELENIHKYSPLMMCVLDETQKVLYINQNMEEFIEKSSESVAHQRACGVFGCIHAHDDERGCGYGKNCENCELNKALDKTLKTGSHQFEIPYNTVFVNTKGKHKEISLLAYTSLIEHSPQKLISLVLVDVSEKLQLENQIRESEQRFKTLYDEAPVSIFIFDKDSSQIIDANKNAYEIYEFESLEELKQNDFWLAPPYSFKEVKEWTHKAANYGKQEFEWLSRKKNGEYFWESVKLIPISINGITHVLAASADITERKQAEEKIFNLFELEKLVAEISLDFIDANAENLEEKIYQMLKKTGMFFKVERAYYFQFSKDKGTAQKISQWTKENREASNKSIWDMDVLALPWWSKQILNENIVRINSLDGLPKEAAKEKEVLQKLNIQSMINVPVIGPDGVMGFFGFDSIKRKQRWQFSQMSIMELLGNVLANAHASAIAHKAITDSENKFRLIFQNIQEGVGIVNSKDEFIFANPAAEKIFEVGKNKLIGKRVYDFLDDQGLEIVEKENHIRRKNTTSSYDLEIMTACQRKKHIIVTATPYRNEQENEVHVFGVFRDITERKEAENLLKENEIKLTELNATKDKFFSILAHDLKNPFQSILGFSSMMARDFDDFSQEDLKSFADMIHSAAKNTYTLLEELLEWAKIQQGQITFKPEGLALDSSIQKALKTLMPLAENKKIRLSINIPDGTMVFADRFKLETIIRNLVGNAIKFTPRHGAVDIEAMHEEGRILLKVSDTGIGMSKEKTQSLFKIEKTKSESGTEGEEGTGLGLLLCKEFVEMHDSKIAVASKEGEGTVFSFCLKPLN